MRALNETGLTQNIKDSNKNKAKSAHLFLKTFGLKCEQLFTQALQGVLLDGPRSLGCILINLLSQV